MTGEHLQRIEEGRGHECGVFGIRVNLPEIPVASLTYLGLQQLQHRGEDSAGIFVSDGQRISGLKDFGRAVVAFNEGDKLSGLPSGHMASGHVRYATHAINGNGKNRETEFRGIQPMIGRAHNPFTVSHNGHIVNFDQARAAAGLTSEQCVTDSELMVRLIERELNGNSDTGMAEAIASATNQLTGAYSLVIMSQDKLFGVRDPHGFRPLWLGEIPEAGYVLASEIPALNIAGAEPVREIAKGEILEIGANGLTSYNYHPEVSQNLCAFEFIYMSRPDNIMEGRNVEQARLRMGQLLAERYPVEADIVIGSPDSGISAAHGYAEASGLPIRRGLVKNSYVGRTFLPSSPQLRLEKANLKFNPIEELVAGQRIVLVDDSIIRGTVTRTEVTKLRQAGAREVHLRIASPPYKWPCFYGMDTPNRNQLIAATHSKEAIAQEVGADSLEYLSVLDLRESVGQAAGKLCLACTTGEYPTPLPEHLLNGNK